MGGSMTNSAMVELFYTIDNISKSNDENDTIVEKIIDNIYELFKSRMKYKKEQERRKAMLKEYKAYLEGLHELITEQMTIIESLSNEIDTYDMVDEFFEIQKKVDIYSMKKNAIEYSYMSNFFSEKECNIFNYTQLYSMFDNYHKSIKEYQSNQKITSVKRIDSKTQLSNWKTYYYLVIGLEKQNDFNQTLLSNYISRRKNIDSKAFFKSKNRLFVEDFQGQLSKTVYCQRKKMKLTQVELSKISGVDRSMIAKIEKAKQPTTLETAIKLLSALNMGVAICPFDGSVETSLLKLEHHN